MIDELSERERALCTLPLPYSLALRLREADVVADLICQCLDVEPSALDGIFRIAEANSCGATGKPCLRPLLLTLLDRTTFESRGQAPPSFQPDTTRGHAALTGVTREPKIATK